VRRDAAPVTMCRRCEIPRGRHRDDLACPQAAGWHDTARFETEWLPFTIHLVEPGGDIDIGGIDDALTLGIGADDGVTPK